MPAGRGPTVPSVTTGRFPTAELFPASTSVLEPVQMETTASESLDLVRLGKVRLV
jgi:hypothetical protein